MRSQATSVASYLRELTPGRRQTLSAVRKVLRAHLPPGYVERMNWGMISYQIPLSRYPDTYNGQPLLFAALADAFRAAGKKLDMGKCCIRFQSAGDLELDAIAAALRSMPPETFIAMYEATRKRPAITRR